MVNAAVVANLVGVLGLPSVEENAPFMLLGFLVVVWDDDDDDAGLSLYSRLTLRRRRAPRENFSFQSLPSFRHSSVIRWQSAQQSRRGIVNSSWRRW